MDTFGHLRCARLREGEAQDALGRNAGEQQAENARGKNMGFCPSPPMR